MTALVKLKLDNENPTLEEVSRLPGITAMDIDKDYGLVCINPQAHLFVIRIKDVVDVENCKRRSSEILDIYGDVRVSAY